MYTDVICRYARLQPGQQRKIKTGFWARQRAPDVRTLFARKQIGGRGLFRPKKVQKCIWTQICSPIKHCNVFGSNKCEVLTDTGGLHVDFPPKKGKKAPTFAQTET